MKPRIGCRTILFGIALIVGVITYLFNTISNNLAGCTNSLLDRFKQTELASQYAKEYMVFLRIEHSDFRGTSVGWSIAKQGEGCLVTASSTYHNSLNKTITYTGDSFFIDLEDKSIYPQSSGAKLFLETYDITTYLP